MFEYRKEKSENNVWLFRILGDNKLYCEKHDIPRIKKTELLVNLPLDLVCLGSIMYSNFLH